MKQTFVHARLEQLLGIFCRIDVVFVNVLQKKI